MKKILPIPSGLALLRTCAQCASTTPWRLRRLLRRRRERDPSGTAGKRCVLVRSVSIFLILLLIAPGVSIGAVETPPVSNFKKDLSVRTQFETNIYNGAGSDYAVIGKVPPEVELEVRQSIPVTIGPVTAEWFEIEYRIKSIKRVTPN